LLADLKAPVNNRRIGRSFQLVANHFFDKPHGIFSLGSGHFPVPCLNGNMLYLHFYFWKPYSETIDRIVEFFHAYQRFDDGDFKTPKTFPYFSNTACYGKHTCYWGIIKLFKGLSFLPPSRGTKNARQLIDHCIDFVLHHEVCFRSHQKDELITPEIGELTFPSLWKDDFLEILWLLSREGVADKRMKRALALLRSKRKGDGSWELERPVPNLILPMGRKGCPNAFISERALEVLNFYKD
jgi:hypothetical protein